MFNTENSAAIFKHFKTMSFMTKRKLYFANYQNQEELLNKRSKLKYQNAGLRGISF